MKPGHLPHPFNRPLRFDQRRQDTRDTDKGDSKGVVVIIVDRPKDNRGDLEHVERVKDLSHQYYRKRFNHVRPTSSTNNPKIDLLAMSMMFSLIKTRRCVRVSSSKPCATARAEVHRGSRQSLIIAHRPVPGSSANRVYLYSITFKKPMVSSQVVLPRSTSCVRSFAAPTPPSGSPFNV